MIKNNVKYFDFNVTYAVFNVRMSSKFTFWEALNSYEMHYNTMQTL